MARVLRQEGLVMDVARKRAWILTTQRPLDRRAIFIANYWPVVELVLKRYEPAALAGLNAIKLHLEDLSPPEECWPTNAQIRASTHSPWSQDSS